MANYKHFQNTIVTYWIECLSRKVNVVNSSFVGCRIFALLNFSKIVFSIQRLVSNSYGNFTGNISSFLNSIELFKNISLCLLICIRIRIFGNGKLFLFHLFVEKCSVKHNHKLASRTILVAEVDTEQTNLSV